MKSRLLASLAMGAAVVLGATGCNMIAPQATTITYSPSDGVNVPDSGPVDVRNAMIIANEDGSAGNFIASLVNTSTEPQTVNIGFENGDIGVWLLDGGTAVTLGVDEDPLLIAELDTPPGATTPIGVQSGGAEGARVEIPVLDGALPYYSEFVPVEDQFITD
ncbi:MULTISPECIES: DNA modification methylase [unclassified Microbacterium]|uniref:DNA modification methylase n=1 Tax=unclassified Microbacterium TaxID=2609290 RepID=UPI00214CD00F|nr:MULTISPECIES: DNA modification methylase [unclassified Microbacterium]MCR2784053.1 DNA modification methylase [Microbacterium sp. zg.B96]MDL5351029.1 DNA modification methylase [Microbacterium sp. zg-YB36]WIM15107.1 DNA modification methylase [Microbacterium sp. zg-B96]